MNVYIHISKGRVWFSPEVIVGVYLTKSEAAAAVEKANSKKGYSDHRVVCKKVKRAK